MTNIIVVFPKIEDAKNIKNVLVRNGFPVLAACSTGAQAIALIEEFNYGIVICGYRMVDMLYSDLFLELPENVEMLLLASPRNLGDVTQERVVRLAMPIKVHELLNTVDMMTRSIERRRKRQKQQPRERKPEEVALIKEAKGLLMDRNHMTEAEAHRYIQKISMDSGTNLVETAKMVLTSMRY